jgi:hypothetical protein
MRFELNSFLVWKRIMAPATQKQIRALALAKDFQRFGDCLVPLDNILLVSSLGRTVNAGPIVWHRMPSSNHVDHAVITIIRHFGSWDSETRFGQALANKP